MASSGNPALPLVGKLHWALSKLPLVGEPLVRGINRAAATAAFHAPLVGGKQSSDIKEVKKQWLEFLNRAGLNPTVTKETDTEFYWEIDACAYGFKHARQQGICDAVMDLDRQYTRLLGGEMTILECIPKGSTHCRFVTRLKK